MARACRFIKRCSSCAVLTASRSDWVRLSNGERHRVSGMAELKSHKLSGLRRRAEVQLSRIIRRSVPSLARENVKALVQELRVHQIELELQCHELQRAQAEVGESRNRYLELYESIPVGYVTIDSDGRIYDLNPMGVSLLGLERDSRRMQN